MSKSIKLTDNTYWDSSCISFKKKEMKDVIDGLVGSVIYDNANNKSTSITCNDNTNNYDIILIQFKPGTYNDFVGIETSIIVSPTNTTYSKTTAFFSSSNEQIYCVCAKFVLSNKDISITTNQYGTVGASNAYTANGGAWYITKVIGFKLN